MYERWSIEEAHKWYADQPLLLGANFVPSTAINQIEMWRSESWDPLTIERELDWAANIGMNTMRVFLHDQLWSEEGEGFLDRIDAFLAICDVHAIQPLLVIFDDCWHEPTPDAQPAPRPGIHNSGWVRSPSHAILLDPDRRAELEEYVAAVFRRFGSDPRILAWDLYNEPTNYFLPSRSMPRREREKALKEVERNAGLLRAASFDLIKKVFRWARNAAPIHPLTAGAWNGDRELNSKLFELSDIISFHNYTPPERLEQIVTRLKTHGRPLFCTEFLARRHGSTFENHLPVFRREKIAGYCWGLVDGKTQTKYAWEDEGDRWAGAEPDPWFHDVFRNDGSPYRQEEAALIAAS